jgi:hypothetical protein
MLTTWYGSCLSKEVHDHQVEHQIAQNKVSKGPLWGKVLQNADGVLAHNVMPDLQSKMDPTR